MEEDRGAGVKSRDSSVFRLHLLPETPKKEINRQAVPSFETLPFIIHNS
jgi:hypothetical protein